ncbi:SLBB domain-containing protein [Chitinispirillales bacterium ANBcel5]|uniref:SLBB domain-containing protein n=1 Tax=Cellulosispirillum alkaliphilum TaxID=3039283 RepID=UPI002A54F31A|nr:SLBB domain-containing protein [Chitinispirillales bacterium ANBcel5]
MSRNKARLLGFVLFIIVFSTESSILQPGDVVDIQIISHPEMSGRFTVRANGTINYPLFSDEIVENRTTAELMNDLVFRLARHIENPLVMVSKVENPEILVTVLGQVKKPGPVVLYENASVQEAIVKAGGILSDANLEKIKIHRNGKRIQAIEVNLKDFFSSGDINLLPDLKADDVVVVLGHKKNRMVKVLGAVKRPGLYEIEEQANIFEMIYMAGGPNDRADLRRVRKITKEDDKTSEEIIDIQALLDQGDMDSMPTVERGDVILVYSRWFDWKTMMSFLNNTLLLLITVQTFAGWFK